MTGVASATVSTGCLIGSLLHSWSLGTALIRWPRVFPNLELYSFVFPALATKSDFASLYGGVYTIYYLVSLSSIYTVVSTIHTPKTVKGKH